MIHLTIAPQGCDGVSRSLSRPLISDCMSFP